MERLTTYEIEKIEKLIQINKFNGIILDGLFYEFKTEEHSLIWNINEEMNLELYNLIEFLRNKVSY